MKVSNLKTIDKLAWLHIRDKRLLCVRSKGADAFYLPGGKREPGEKDGAALIREIWEELSVEIVPETIKFSETFEAPAHGKVPAQRVTLTCYRADFKGILAIAAEIEEKAFLGFHDRERCSEATRLVIDWLFAKGEIE